MAIEKIQSEYESLIVEYGLSPTMKDFFQERLSHAITSRRTAENFIEEEMSELKKLKEDARKEEIKNLRKLKAHERVVSEQTFADKVLRKKNSTIAKYPILEIHPHADQEISRLYGAINELDKEYWVTIEAYLRKRFPRSGNVRRTSIEQRLWQFTPSHESKLPESLRRYHRLLELSSAPRRDLFAASQAAVKAAAFFLHEILDLCESSLDKQGGIIITEELKSAIAYIQGILKDFQLSELKQAVIHGE